MFTSKPIRRRLALPALLFHLAFLGGGAGADPAGGPTPALSWHKLILRDMTPSDLLRLMHWGATTAVPPPTAPATPPEGVQRIYALESDNSLLIQSTPDGYARVREILKSLIVAPRRIQFKVQFVRARIADVKALGLFSTVDPLQHSAPYGAKVVAALESLIAGGSEVLGARTFSAVQDGGVFFPYRADLYPPPPASPLPFRLAEETIPDSAQARVVWIGITPHLNQDGTLVLTLTSTGGDEDRTLGSRVRTVGLTSELQSGDTLALGGLISGRQTELLVFVTPTLLPQEPAAGNDSAQERGMMSAGPNVSVAP